MNYLLFKLRFQTAVHFGLSDSALSLYASGDHFLADTLFSALCQMQLSLNGPEGVEQLCKEVQEGRLLFSDSMPWQGDTLYLPKPMITAESHREVPERLRKAMKRLSWIPVEAMGQFADSLRGGDPYPADRFTSQFGIHAEMTRVRHNEGGDSVPYQVGLYRFLEECGLWFLAGYEDAEQAQRLEKLVTLLGLSGIGGKTSSGLGRFAVEQVISVQAEAGDEQIRWLYESLRGENTASLLLTSSLPMEAELEEALEDASFQLVRRSGFVQSDRFAQSGRKKRPQMFLCAGSVLKHRFRGDLYSVGEGGSHKVYRYGKPIFLGVEL